MCHDRLLLPLVLQAKECLALLPDSAAGQEQLGAIAAGEQLKQLGLDLPPLQLQQLREQAASGGGKVLEQASCAAAAAAHTSQPAHRCARSPARRPLATICNCCLCLRESPPSVVPSSPSCHGLQLVGDHPQLAAADSAKLMQVAAALGIRQQPEPLLLRAAEAAHASGNRARTRGLLLQLAAMQYR